MPANKIATCCYCGTRSVLRLRGKHRHELSCANCGAPLRALKNLPREQLSASAPTSARPDKRVATDKRRKKPKRAMSFRRKMFAKMWDELADVIDDAFEELFD
ncbi:hypothetical protein DS901_12045 [Loktanella sp. D2R18]|uniref:hypothetical protein n=1 Tax=Rhodobacterales TaxID=204455 RepID=UPI000DEAADA1|nr:MULTISPECIES: hypothetical protein [Rhodobacterales]MDO6590222.1 hypothetical protein [Yoonia sp. 1_MG-2023]RBW42959.1 hypothetical protein DS901_12045 [Loktanella sp. D2R18]